MTARDSNVYRVTREKQEVCWKKNCGHEVSDRMYNSMRGGYFHWVRHTKICSQRYPSERLISVEQAPHAAFEDVTKEMINASVNLLR